MENSKGFVGAMADDNDLFLYVDGECRGFIKDGLWRITGYSGRTSIWLKGLMGSLDLDNLYGCFPFKKEGY